MVYEKCNEDEAKKDEKTAPLLIPAHKDEKDDSLQKLSKRNDKAVIQERFAKLSVEMKNYCGIHLRLSHRINDSDLNGLKLNPEWQIKILEENLSFLYNKNSTCGFFQMKSSSRVLNTSSKLFKFDCKSQTTPKHNMISETDQAIELRGKGSTLSEEMDGIHHTTLSKTENSAGSESKMFHPLQSKESTKPQANSYVVTPIGLRKNLANIKRDNMQMNRDTKPFETSKHNDSDNNFEFTVEGEKIVSFVCSPSPPRTQRFEASGGQPMNIESDLEPEYPVITVSKSSAIPETSSVNSDKPDTSFTKNKYELFSSHPEDSSKLLWHPTFSRENFNLPTVKKTECREDHTSCSSNVQGTLLLQNMETSLSRETTLFREMALRSCYTMETILSDTNTSHLRVHKEVRQVRESIFSAISGKESSENIVTDNILSILDIIKSWVKLNSNFQNKEFKEYLEMNGIDQSVTNDFLQWQCVSRVFIDKFMHILNNIFPGQHPFTDPAVLKKGCCFSASPTSQNNDANQLSTKTRNNCTQKYSPSVKTCSLGISNYWNQHRLSSDEDELDLLDAAYKRPVHPNITVKKFCPLDDTMNRSANISHRNISSANQIFDINLESFNKTVSSKMQLQDDSSFQMNSIDTRYSCPLTSSKLTLNNSDVMSRLPSIGGVCNASNQAGLYGLGGVLSVPAITFTSTPLEVVTTPKRSVAPHLYISQPGNGIGSSQVLANSNPKPIKPKQTHYNIDTDVGETNAKCNYMKPGSYNPPQKPTNFLTVVNNNFPIEDPPVIGVPFLYNGNQSSSKVSAVNGSLMKPDRTESGPPNTSPEQCWKAALSSAEMFRKNLMTSKPADDLNFILCDNASTKTHFLLGDESSQDSSSIDLKFRSENDEPSTKHNLPSDLDFSVVETQLKTSDWLVKSFHVRGKDDNTNHVSTLTNIENGMFSVIPCDENETGSVRFKSMATKPESLPNKPLSSPVSSGSDSFNSGTTNNHLDTIHTVQKQDFQCDVKGKRIIKPTQHKYSKPINEEYLTSSDGNTEFFVRKPKTVTKRPITKEITFKLEKILNCIWNTNTLGLVEGAAVTEKDASKLELKIRSPLYFQALKCKLLNHSYDTLDQALADIHQYFLDTKNRNKGDKQCVDATEILERVYLDLVETHFGTSYHPSNSFGPVGSTTMKSKRLKRANRK